MGTLFEAAAGDPSLTQEIVDAMRSAVSDVGAETADDPFAFVQLASENPALKAAMQSRLSQMADARGLSFVSEAAASLNGAKAILEELKDKPTQVPIGTPMALLFIAAALLFIPSILSVAGATLFGTDAMSSALEGVDLFG